MKKILLILFIICSITNSYGIVSTKQGADCVEIVLKNGIKIQVQIIESSATGISYRICNAQDTSVRKLEKKDISTVKSFDGKLIFGEDNRNMLEKKDRRKIHPLAISAVVSAVLSILFGLLSFSDADIFSYSGSASAVIGIVFAIIGAFFSGFAISGIEKQKDKYKGSSMAKAGVALNLVALLLTGLVYVLFNLFHF